MKFQASQCSCPDRTSSQSRRRSSSNSFSIERRTYDTCWYHFKFGCEARKCTKPCNFNTQSEKRSHQQQVKTTLDAGLKQGSRLFYIRGKNTGYLFLSKPAHKSTLFHRILRKTTNYPHSHCRRQMDSKLKLTER